ncbi:hypothetical protein DFP72DRAFT_1084595 [Ephemerocybe angulata]|uniref:Uncharacterized protein n=1 Tax=Ephemerocybe angulata TaxID=980116 RepID=A0A8H6H818_9AGAR|nr:hypothetical protein DFP72DRAFT_1084595 [Tulosesus angulatus]
MAEEASTIWPQTWRTGKFLFLLTRYAPILTIPPIILTGFRVYVVLSPEICRGLWIAVEIIYRTTTIASEVVLLLCLYALLGARRRHLVPLAVVYLGLTFGASGSVFKYISEGSLALPSSGLTQDLGYACTLRGTVSISAIEGREIAGYVALAKSIAIWCFAIAIFYVRYKNQSGTLISVLRRDSGVYFFSITAMRLANAIAGTFRHRLGFSNVPDSVLQGILTTVLPILACRLLFNMQKNEDAATPSAVSTLLFEPPRWNEGSHAGPGESHGDAVEMARYAGLGRRSGV